MTFWRIGAYSAGLLWLNAYICRDLFFSGFTGNTNSMQGFWAAIARHASSHWFQPSWWRWWDAGMPFEYTYAPLVPALAAAYSAIAGVSELRGVQGVTGLFYCLTPVTVFLMCAVLTRRAGWSFSAATAYSLLSPMNLILPDEPFAWIRLGSAQRLYLMTAWDETPHYAAVTMVTLVVLFAALAMRTRRPRFWLLAGVCMTLAALSNAFGMVTIVLALVPLAAVLETERWKQNLIAMTVTGVVAWIVASPFLPPSLVLTMAANAQAQQDEIHAVNLGGFTAVAITIFGAAVLGAAMRGRRAVWWLQWLVLFAWVTFSIPLVHRMLGRHFLPQPNRYKVEAELGLTLAAVFALERVLSRTPRPVQAAAALLGLAIAAEQVVGHRRYEKLTVRSRDETSSIEYRVARWMEANVPAGRVFASGSIAQWLNLYSSTEQMAGSSYSTAYNRVQQIAYWGIFTLERKDADLAIAWLKACGVQAVAVPGRSSPEFWKGFQHPDLFEGTLPVAWREDDTTIYRIPEVGPWYAHAVPRSARVRTEPKHIGQDAEVRRYAAALDAAPHLEFRWTGANTAHVSGLVSPEQAVSVQVTHHRGWRARANGRSVPVQADALGLMWLEPSCSGRCELELEYTGGWELRLCRASSLLALIGIGAWIARRKYLHRSRGAMVKREEPR